MTGPLVGPRSCPKCGGRFEPSERREGGWLYVIYRCADCGHAAVVTFAPHEVEARERARREGHEKDAKHSS